jgi:hypothetical protein
VSKEQKKAPQRDWGAFENSRAGTR